MTDNQLADLLYYFHRIEELMVKNGAKETNTDGTPTSFSDKVKSFDNFENEPNDPGDIGYKFYYDDDEYHIKDDYQYDVGIEDELEEYEEYKSYKKRRWEHRNEILGGNYNTLKQIGHERNQLLHIYNYQINNYNKFVKVCESMIKYFENPDKKPFLGFETLASPTSTRAKSRKSSHTSKSKIFDGIGIYVIFGILWGIISIIGELNNRDPKQTTRNQENKHIASTKTENTYNSKKTIKKCRYYYIDANSLNLRSKPRRGANKVGSMNKNTKVCIRKTKNGWSYIDGKGWVSSQYLSPTKVKTKKKEKKKKVSHAVWHCEARSQRASGWVERVGKQNAMNGAIRQCELRRQTNTKCRIVNCYKR